jgi:hypothetical protein
MRRRGYERTGPRTCTTAPQVHRRIIVILPPKKLLHRDAFNSPPNALYPCRIANPSKLIVLCHPSREELPPRAPTNTNSPRFEALVQRCWCLGRPTRIQARAGRGEFESASRAVNAFRLIQRRELPRGLLRTWYIQGNIH